MLNYVVAILYIFIMNYFQDIIVKKLNFLNFKVMLFLTQSINFLKYLTPRISAKFRRFPINVFIDILKVLNFWIQEKKLVKNLITVYFLPYVENEYFLSTPEGSIAFKECIVTVYEQFFFFFMFTWVNIRYNCVSLSVVFFSTWSLSMNWKMNPSTNFQLKEDTFEAIYVL